MFSTNNNTNLSCIFPVPEKQKFGGEFPDF